MIFSDRPYLFFFNLLECGLQFYESFIIGCTTPQICVAHCPNITFSVYDQLTVSNDVDVKQDNNNNWIDYVICKHGITPTISSVRIAKQLIFPI